MPQDLSRRASMVDEWETPLVKRCLLLCSSALDSAHEALWLLDSVPKTPQNEEQLQDDKAQALLWLYICTIEDKMREVCGSKQSSTEFCRLNSELLIFCVLEVKCYSLYKIRQIISTNLAAEVYMLFTLFLSTEASSLTTRNLKKPTPLASQISSGISPLLTFFNQNV